MVEFYGKMFGGEAHGSIETDDGYGTPVAFELYCIFKKFIQVHSL